jgi:hypothetical protein
VKKILTIFLCIFTLQLINVTEVGNATVNHRVSPAYIKKPGFISSFGWAVGVCETGKGHKYPDFKHKDGIYEGFVGWYYGTWDLDKVGITTINHAYQASPKIQNKVAAISFKKHRYFGCISNKGYKYWL